jgi:GT2 family glycosyltransferase
MKIAVVILNWNGKDLLKTFLPSVVKNCNDNIDLYVADNASSDTSISYIQDNFKTVKIVALDKNYGYADGYNRSLSQITADIYVLLNSDVEVAPGWLDGIVKRFELDDRIAAIQPKILAYKDKSSFEYAGAAGGYIDRWGYTFCRGRIFDHIEKDLEQYDSDSEIFWASGACLFIRSSVYNEVNGLDPDFFAHMEEIDLCWRIKNRGYKIWYQQFTIWEVGP